jgi:hypothetical protein
MPTGSDQPVQHMIRQGSASLAFIVFSVLMVITHASWNRYLRPLTVVDASMVPA